MKIIVRQVVAIFSENLNYPISSLNSRIKRDYQSVKFSQIILVSQRYVKIDLRLMV